MRIHKVPENRLFGLIPIALAAMALLFGWNASADYEDGVNAAFDGDFDTAFREFSAAAEEGLDLAQYNLGILYFTGQGVDQDLEQAFTWTEAAANQGHLNAQFNLGSLYFEGQGTAKNNVRGIDWFTRAGHGGHPNAAFALAKMYQNGDPMTKDLIQAHAWAAKAANNDHDEGIVLKEEIANALNPSELSQARRLFATWQLEALPPVLPNR
jgi:uncharacterized protein